MHFSSSSDVASTLPLVSLHRAVQQSCRRSYRWNSVPVGDPLNHLQVCLLRRLITLMRRVAYSVTTATAGAQNKMSVRAHHNATLAAVVSSAIRPSALTDVEEFKMLMWDSLSSVFPNDQALADAVGDLSKDGAALEEMVHSALLDLNSVGGSDASHFDGTYELDLVELAQATVVPLVKPRPQHPGSASATSGSASSASLAAPSLKRVGFGSPSSTSTTPDNSLNMSSLFHPMQSGDHTATTYRPSSGSSRCHRNPNGLNSMTLHNSSCRGKSSPTATTLGESLSSVGKKVWSRQALLVMLFVLVVVSLTASLQAWRDLRRGEANGTWSPRERRHREQAERQRQVEQQQQHFYDMDGSPVEHHSIDGIATEDPTTAPPTTTSPPALRASLPKWKRSDIMESLRNQEREMWEGLQRERTLADAHQRARHVQSADTAQQPLPHSPPAPPAMPTAQHPCGRDSTKNPSGLPGRSYDAVDSITALSFDLTDEELATIAKLEAAKLASRHTYIRDLVARAMDADPRNDASPYHSFFANRNATMEAVDVKDRLAPVPVDAQDEGKHEGVLLRRRSHDSASFTCPAVQPALVDVVYTYVNPNSASHKSAASVECQRGTQGCSEHRFRDFNELMYSLRTVHHRGGMQADASGEQAGRFVGNVFIVVAERDQIPGWLRHEPVSQINSIAPPPPRKSNNNGNIIRHEFPGSSRHSNANHSSMTAQRQPGRIFSVTHKDIFPPESHSTALPTFNSFAIETNLHRIPGVSRFFVYFNNDMFWGRKVSYFDYFRPISHVRQQHRIETTLEGQCLAEHFRKSTAGTVIGAEDASPSQPAAPSRRAVVFMEPVHYFDREDELADRRLTPKNVPIPPQYGYSRYHQRVMRNSRGRVVPIPVVDQIPPPPAPAPQATQDLMLVSDNSTPSCALTPVKTNAVFRLSMKVPHDTPHMTANYNRRLLFEHYGLPPSHAFAHYPGIYDRAVLGRMMDEELQEAAHATRNSHLRGQDSLWTTWIYPFVAFAHRRGVDNSLVAGKLRLWQRSTSYDELSKNIKRLGPLVDPNFGSLPKSYQGNMWLSKDAAAAAKVPAIGTTLGNIGHNVAHEKLRDWVVTMDGKNEPIYHFCMMTSGSMVSRYLYELQMRMKLFVTANDDLSYLNPSSVDAVNALMHLVSRGAPATPWEQ